MNIETKLTVIEGKIDSLNGNKFWKFIDKLIVPIFIGFLAYSTSNTSNRISESQLEFQKHQNTIQAEKINQNLELKYLELFYQDINSDNLKKQIKAIGLLRLMNPELGLQLSEWAKLNVDLPTSTKRKVDDINKDLRKEINSVKYVQEGIRMSRKGNFNSSIKYYDLHLKAIPNDVDVLGYKGYSLYRLNKHSEAIRILEKAIDIDKTHRLNYHNLALSFWANNQENEAIETLRVLLEFDSNYKFTILRDPQFIKFQRNTNFKTMISEY